MGLGDWGTILLVLAAAWGVYTFVLSPQAGINREVGGGLFELATHNDEALHQRIEKNKPKISAGIEGMKRDCPICLSGDKEDSAACQKCVERNRSRILDDVQSAKYAYSY